MRFRVVTMIVTLLLVGAAASGADDGAALYKKKCAGCHGASGEGKAAIIAPAVKRIRCLDGQITVRLVKVYLPAKACSKKGTVGLTEAQAKAIAAFIKTL